MAILGQKINSLNYAMTVSQATSTVPLDTQEPEIVVAVLPSNSVAATYTIITEIVYHCQFFDLFADNA